MSAELIILASAILGAFAFILIFQLRKLLVEKQVPLNDLDAIVKALFELELNREFFLKLVIGTAMGAVGAVLSLAALTAGAPTDVQGLLIYGFLWGLAGNGILRVFTMFPEIFTVLQIAKENANLKQQNALLVQQNQTLQALNSSLGTNASNNNNEDLVLGKTNPDGSISV